MSPSEGLHGTPVYQPDRDTKMSVSQFADLLGLEPTRLIAVELDKLSSTVTIVQEPENHATI